MKFWKGAEMVLIAVGANLPLGGQEALTTCHKVVETLRALPGLHVIGVSRWYESAPVPPSGQPPYINGVIRATTTLTPDALLAALQQVELDFGRERSVRNAARTLDLDIIAFDALCQNLPHLTLPHPRAHERAFVLLPLRDVMPDWVHPATGQSLEAMLAQVAGQEIRQIQE
ncbi:2-amino-4-hydroxy-6-hydroxymethyldihydropteridine pyrophosphokinase [Acetobacter senegalensis]|uniref:2-amino-4-hydroxy-6-hydroxymethyldihydropteridine pyrophosphokinase n=2 Tax=Acetobacter TaxID=434 RepID=A0A252ELA4_9PROT|nr:MULTISPECIES: 2-amino-4-hydroxy-6-hydroxymethyldihydropteridine diphosphokinase [Acetobacter]ATJ92143.1 2-amino-4-hydroxy-6-hydroxymethyldihydropteridine diphosphokinase [Acetobacter tropicalis]OUL67201.1 2-amino-4-hydroxy-6-hydroxymethyldihydropteridine pyrophosphokinase [Acetobacter senegalensis]